MLIYHGTKKKHQPEIQQKHEQKQLALWTYQAFCIFYNPFLGIFEAPKLRRKAATSLYCTSVMEKRWYLYKTQPRWHKMMISWAFLYIHKGTIYKFIYRMWCATWTSFCWRQIWCSVSTSPGRCSQRIDVSSQGNQTVPLSSLEYTTLTCHATSLFGSSPCHIKYEQKHTLHDNLKI